MSDIYPGSDPGRRADGENQQPGLLDFEPQPASSDGQSTAGHAKDAAADVAGSGKRAAADVAQTGRAAAADVAGEAQAQASDLIGKTRTQLREQTEAQRTSVVESLHSLADQLAAMTDDVGESGTAVDAAVNARDRARGAADWLDQRDGGQVLDEVRRIGRNRPGAFLLTAAVAGVLAGRLTRGAVAVHTDDDSSEQADSHEGAASHRAGGQVTR